MNDRGLTIGLVIALFASIFVLGRLLKEKQKGERQERNAELLEIGEKIDLPRFITDISGNPITLDGQIVLLFFDPNCGACVDEAPIWDDFYIRVKPKAKVIGISRGDKSILKSFVDRLGVSYPIIEDSKGTIFEKFRVAKIPFDVFVNNGTIVLPSTSIYHSPNVLVRAIEKHIGL